MSLHEFVIDRHIKDILPIIVGNADSSIVAGTGSGKSLRMPHVLAQLEKPSPNGRDKSPIRVFCAEPTILAATSLAAAAAKIEPAVNVGYAADREFKYNDDTRLVYATVGHVVNRFFERFSEAYEGTIIAREGIDFCDILILDEVHTGSIENSMVIILWEAARSLGAITPRLVLATATPNPTGIGGLSPTVFTVNVEYKYKQEISYLRVSPRTDREVAVMVAESIVELSTGGILARLDEGHPIMGSIAVFVAGERESIHCYQEIRRKGLEKEYDIIFVSRRTLASNKEKIMETPPLVGTRGGRKLFLTTNIAESAITIPDLIVVIDTLKEKINKATSSGGTSLVLTNASHDSATQRAGRVGRTRRGFVKRIASEVDFNNPTIFPLHRLPEIVRLPLYDPIIRLIGIGLEPEVVLPSSVPRENIAQSTSLLHQLKMIIPIDMVSEKVGEGKGERGEGKGEAALPMKATKRKWKTTACGKFGVRTKLGARAATLLYQWTHNLTPSVPAFPGVIIACAIDQYGPSYFILKDEKDQSRDQVLENRPERWDLDKANDISIILAMWKSLSDAIGFEKVSRGKYRYAKESLDKWSHVWMMNRTKISELVKRIVDVNSVLDGYRHIKKDGEMPLEDIEKVMDAIISDVYRDKVAALQPDGRYIRGGTEYVFDKHGPSRISEGRHKYIASIAEYEIPHSSKVIMNLAFPVSRYFEELPKEEEKAVGAGAGVKTPVAPIAISADVSGIEDLLGVTV